MRHNRVQVFSVVMIACFMGAGAFAAASKDAGQQIECKDGTIAKKGRGACSHHGGLAQTVSTSTANPTAVPESATVLCKDGTSAKKGSGACSGHGGMAGPMSPARPTTGSSQQGKGTGGSQGTGAAASSSGGQTAPSTGASSPTRPSGNKGANATARCKDGTLSYSAQHEGACSHHGGVAEWLDIK